MWVQQNINKSEFMLSDTTNKITNLFMGVLAKYKTRREE